MSEQSQTLADYVNKLRDEWDARCHFCGGPAFPWLTDYPTWAKVEPLLGQQQTCLACFVASWFAVGLNDGEPFVIRPAHSQPETGAELIAAERERQMTEEGWTSEHDDQHTGGVMAAAAACYAIGKADVTINGVYLWPWENRWWKPAPRIRELAKAGALIAAEIDRLQRIEADENFTAHSQPGPGS